VLAFNFILNKFGARSEAETGRRTDQNGFGSRAVSCSSWGSPPHSENGIAHFFALQSSGAQAKRKPGQSSASSGTA
jgi:hypothetical protein